MLTWTLYSTLRRDWSNLCLVSCDRNNDLDFVNISHQWTRREQDPQIVAASIIKWMGLLGVLPSDEVLLPTARFDAEFDPSSQHTIWLASRSHDKDWEKQLSKCVEANRKAKGLLIEPGSLPINNRIHTEAPPTHNKSQLPLSKEETTSERRSSASSAASGFGPSGASERDIEMVDLTQDSD